MNTNSQLPLARPKRAKQSRYHPLPGLNDPLHLTRKLDAFEAGYLKDSVNIRDALEQRDDLIRAVVSKRKKESICKPSVFIRGHPWLTSPSLHIPGSAAVVQKTHQRLTTDEPI
jgi:hypothetical protein